MIFLSLVGILLAGLLVLWALSPGKLPALRDAEGKKIEGAINDKVFIEVGGIRQGMFIRGENPENPVILYLHGGPGTPLLPFISYLEKPERLEKYFTVCYWDQRGSGMSFSRGTDTLTVEQMVEDTHEVATYLRERFGQQKIYFMGQSWGTYLGVKVIERYQEDYLAYLGIGQATCQRRSEQLAYEFLAEREPEVLKPFDPDAADFPTLKYLVRVRTKLLNKYGIGHLHRGLKFSEMAKGIALFRGYTLREKLNWFLGADFSMIHLFPQMLGDDLFASSARFEIPVYVAQGKYDFQVSSTLAEQWLSEIEAPEKRFFLFENSAHSPNMEEPERFVEVVREVFERSSEK